MSKRTEEAFEKIARDAETAAGKVQASPEEYLDGLESIVEWLQGPIDSATEQLQRRMR